MKQFTPIMTLLLATATGAFAQTTEQLPNGGFETWIQRSPQTHEEPSGWYSLNFLKKYGYPSTTSKTTDAHTGSYAVLLESKPGAFSDIPGLLCSNHMFDSLDNPDFNLNLVPFQSRPLSVSFWYKSAPVANDTIVFQMQLFRWNSVTHQHDTIGEANMSFVPATATYTQATCLFQYASMLTPDSASIIFSTTVEPFSPAIGAKLFLDDLQLNYPATGIGSTAAAPVQFSVYPNPVTETLHVEANETVTRASLMNMSGSVVEDRTIGDQHFRFDCSVLPAGIYLLHLQTRSGETHTIRFTK